MIYAQETYDQVVEEIKPLIMEHYEEIAMHKDIPLEPDWKRYKAMEESGVLTIFTCRLESGELIGYALYLISPHLHYMSCITAYQDILFIRKEYRGRGMNFILWCDEQLKKNGCSMSVHHVKAAHNFGAALEKIGYKLMDLIYTRRL